MSPSAVFGGTKKWPLILEENISMWDGALEAKGEGLEGKNGIEWDFKRIRALKVQGRD